MCCRGLLLPVGAVSIVIDVVAWIPDILPFAVAQEEFRDDDFDLLFSESQTAATSGNPLHIVIPESVPNAVRSGYPGSIPEG